MNKKLIRNISRGIILIFSIVFVFSCSKKSDENTKSEKKSGDTSTTTVSGDTSTGFKETDEDLLTTDFDYFYKELSSHGEWVEVKAKDLGLDIKPGSSSNNEGIFYDFFTDLFVKKAYAEDVDVSLFVWQPGIGFSVSTGDNQPAMYVPYNNGQWLNTEDGWYFKASTAPEELTSHYGRWTLDPNLGWVWLPGRVWAPAWVDWREDADYVAWAPVPPGTYIVNDAISVTQVNENRYTIVEKKRFIEPSVYKYRYQYVENKNKIMIKEMTKTDGVIVKNKTVINKGPEVGSIEKASGKKIEQVKIKRVDNKNSVGLADNTISIYTPPMKKVSNAKKEPVSKPPKLVAYKDAKKITKEEKESLKEKEKEQKKEEKELKKEEKKGEKEGKKEQKKEEKESKKEEKGKDKDKGKGNEKKDNGNKNDKGKGKK